MIKTHFFSVMDYVKDQFFRCKNIVFVVLLFFLFSTQSYSKTLILAPLEEGVFSLKSKVFSSSTVRVFKISNKVNELVDIESYPDYLDIPYYSYLSLSKYLAKDSFSLGSSRLIKSSSSLLDLAYYTLRYPDSFKNIVELPLNSLDYLMDNSRSYQIRGLYYPFIYNMLSSQEDISVILYTMLKDPSVLNEFWQKELNANRIKRLPTLISLYDSRLDAFSLNFSNDFFDVSSRVVGLTTKLIEDLNRTNTVNNRKHSFVFAEELTSPIGEDIYKIFQSKLRSGLYNIDFSFIEYDKSNLRKSIYKYYNFNMDGTYNLIDTDGSKCEKLFTGG